MKPVPGPRCCISLGAATEAGTDSGAGVSAGIDAFGHAPKTMLGTRGRVPRVSEDKLPLLRESKALVLPPPLLSLSILMRWSMVGEKSIALSRRRSLRLFRRTRTVSSMKATTRAKRPAEAKVAIIAGLLWKKATPPVEA